MRKVLIATEKPFAQDAITEIESSIANAGYIPLFLEKYQSKSEFISAVKDVEAIIVRSDKVDAEIIDAAPNLKVIVRAGAGYDNVDWKYAASKGVKVMNTPGQNSNAVAELVFGLLICSCRNNFNGAVGVELFGKRIGIHGYGKIGQNIARIAHGFAMKVMVYRRTELTDLPKHVTYVDCPEKMYVNCDYIVNTLPLNDSTRGSIDSNLLSLMPIESTLVNVGRKEVLDEVAIAKRLAEQPGFRFAADVAPDNRAELEQDFPDRVTFTDKKMGAQTREANVKAGAAAANQIVALFEKNDRTHVVN